MPDPALVAASLTRTYRRGGRPVVACDDVSLTLEPGELVVLRGRSGAGKTTLLNLLGGLDRPDAGSVRVDGRDLATASAAEAALVRRTTIGFVFQGFGLLPVLTAAENVGIPLRLRRVPAAERERRVARALDAVGLAAHARQRPDELSGGQQQRVGIARALVGEPQVLLADEPTGQLDSVTAASVMDLLLTVVRGQRVAALVTTHDPALAARADRVLQMHDGRLGPG